MKKLLVFLFILIFIYGCGQTNYLEWADSASGDSDSIEDARTYIDEAEYSKALDKLDDYLDAHPNDAEANILYGQALMGDADVELATIMVALSRETTHDSPAVQMEFLVSDGNRSKIYDAANRFITYQPTDNSDKIIAALCCMAAHSSALKESFGGLGTDLDSLDSVPDGTNVTAEYNNFKTIQGGNSSKFILNSFTFMASLITDDELNEAIVSMNQVMEAAEQLVSANSGTAAWGAPTYIKALFGYY